MKIVFSAITGVIVDFALLKINIQNSLKNVMISVKDVMNMSEKRFVYEEEHFPIAMKQIRDTLTDRVYDLEDITDVLNEQQTIILNLKLRLEKINGGYGHLTHKNGLTPNEWLLSKQERELKKKDEQISNWIEQHSKDIERISEQQKEINKLKEELSYCEKFRYQVFQRLSELNE